MIIYFSFNFLILIKQAKIHMKSSFSNQDQPQMDIERANSRLKIPNQFICPISQTIMMDPVIAKDGHSYQRSKIQQWFSIKSTSPLTNLALSSKELVKNTALKSLIQTFINQSRQKQYQQKQNSYDNSAFHHQERIRTIHALLIKQVQKSNDFRSSTIHRLQTLQNNVQNAAMDVNGFRRRIRSQLRQDIDVKWAQKRVGILLFVIVLFAITIAALIYNSNQQIAEVSKLKNYIALNANNLTKISNQIAAMEIVMNVKDARNEKKEKKRNKNKNKNKKQVKIQIEEDNYDFLQQYIYQEETEEYGNSFFENFKHLLRFASVFSLGGLLMIVLNYCSLDSAYNPHKKRNY